MKQSKRYISTRRAKTTPQIKFLRETTCQLVYAELLGFYENGQKIIKANLTKKELIDRFNNSIAFLPKITNYQYEDHFAGIHTHYHYGDEGPTTLYYYGNGKTTDDSTIGMIDIDSDDRQEAERFAQHLKRTHWNDFLYEPSSRGIGINGYIVVNNYGIKAESVNKAYKHLEAWLNQEAKGFGIKKVEVKGTCPVITFDEHGWMQSVKYGQAAKLPRIDVRNTTQLHISEIWELSVEQQEEEEPKKDKAQQGSISGKVITEDDLAAMPKYELLYERLCNEHNQGQELKARRHRVTARDFAIWQVLAKFFKENPEADHSLPITRFKNLWEALYECGDVDRGWNHHRFKAIRDFLSKLGYNLWHDNRYQPGKQCCKWEITDEFYELLVSQEEGKASFLDTSTLPKGTGEFLVPVLSPIQEEEDAKYLIWAEEQVNLLFAA